MRTRPWPLLIVALMHLIAPALNIVLSAWMQSYPIPTYLKLLFAHSSALELFAFFGLFPIAGAAIYAMKMWSYPVFVSIMAWSFVSNYQTWKSFPEVFHIGTLISIYAVNLLTVSYFLLPAVRSVYFNPRMRWWESKPRFEIWTRGRLLSERGKKPMMIANLSEGGAFIKTQIPLQAGDSVQLRFQVMRQHLVLDGEVVYRRTGEGRGFGVRFVHTPLTRRRVARLTRGLELIGMQPRTDHRLHWSDFKCWARSLVRTGKGWAPELPQNPVPASVVSISSTNDSSERNLAA